MQIKERNYDFRKRMAEIFPADSRDESLQCGADEVEITGGWRIETAGDHPLVTRAADDLQRFLDCSMMLRKDGASGKIMLSVQEEGAGRSRPSCSYEASERDIRLTGNSPRALLYGVVHLEDLMLLRRAPFLKKGFSSYRNLMRMRSTHSGCGLDEFPDWQLDAILHAGFTAIDLFVSGPDRNAKGDCDINDIIHRAAAYGLDVVLYSYLKCYVHPDDPGAEERFEEVYGELFRRYPEAAAIHLVGESLEFPSHDPMTVKKSSVEQGSGGFQLPEIPTGYYPNSDYPQYISCIRDAIHRHAPSAEVIFNTYNWGWVDLPPRRRFLEQFPKGVTLQITYDIFKEEHLHGLSCPVMDYSIYAEEPSYYFSSEVKAAHDCGITDMRTTSNLAGNTWDFGCVPYVPVPFRWIRRMEILRDYLLKYGVNSFYDSHHYGWAPNICNDLVKAIFSEEGLADPEAFLHRLAIRDYGAAAAADIVEAWRIWSRAMDHYVASNEDQYGPWRVGAAYPFVFQPVISRTMDDKNVTFPLTDRSYRSEGIVKPIYHPYENSAQSPGPLRYPVEIAELEIMEREWNRGLELVEKAVKTMTGRQEDNGGYLEALGHFIRNSIRTTLGIKRWWRANMRLQNAEDRQSMLEILAEIQELLEKERANVLDTVPWVELDSRLGWEPRMDYVCDRPHLEWKLRQLDSAETEIAAYEKMIRL